MPVTLTLTDEQFRQLQDTLILTAETHTLHFVEGGASYGWSLANLEECGRLLKLEGEEAKLLDDLLTYRAVNVKTMRAVYARLSARHNTRQALQLQSAAKLYP